MSSVVGIIRRSLVVSGSGSHAAPLQALSHYMLICIAGIAPLSIRSLSEDTSPRRMSEFCYLAQGVILTDWTSFAIIVNVRLIVTMMETSQKYESCGYTV